MRDKSVDTLPWNGPFLHSGYTYPLPLSTPATSPKINVEFWTLESVFYFSHHWFGGGGELRHLKRMRTYMNQMFVKSTLFKQVCQLLLSLIVWNMYLCFPARFLTRAFLIPCGVERKSFVLWSMPFLRMWCFHKYCQ